MDKNVVAGHPFMLKTSDVEVNPKPHRKRTWILAVKLAVLARLAWGMHATLGRASPT